MTAAEPYQLASHDNMAQKLSVIGIVVFRKIGNLLQLPYIMKKSCCKQKVSFQKGILLYVEIAEPHHPQGVFQQSSTKL